MYKIRLWNGTSGGNLLGTGAAGFMLLVVIPEHRELIANTLSHDWQYCIKRGLAGICVTDLSVFNKGLVND
jgi:galactokinase/mevalonate kinase-like predicted kinase